MSEGFRERITELVDLAGQPDTVSGDSAQIAVMRSVSGGDMADAYRVDLEDGRTVFAKTHRDPPPGFFSTEAAGLRWLDEPGVINVARVIGVADSAPSCLVLEWIDEGRQPDREGEADFGRSLAALHQSGAESFGRSDGRTTGSLALPNDPCDTWAEFYAERRLRPLAQIAAERHALSNSTIANLLDVAERLDDFPGSDEPPARLHGDLWAGNRIIDAHGASWLIDPACHGGHREFDLAMMQLFGGFGDDCYRSYDEAYPLTPGWQARVPLHQLAPLVVHAIKFGGHYPGAVDRALAELT